MMMNDAQLTFVLLIQSMNSVHENMQHVEYSQPNEPKLELNSYAGDLNFGPLTY